jgi:TPR repeat protein
MLVALRTGCIGLALALSGCTPSGDGKVSVTSSKPAPAEEGASPHLAAAPGKQMKQVNSWPRDFKADEYPGGAFAITDFGSPPPGDAAEAIRTLEPLARNGSSKASYEIFLKLNECLDIEKATEESQPQSDETIAWRKESHDKCKNLNPDDYSKMQEWLLLAASQGSLPAQLSYATNVEAVLGGPTEYLSAPEAVIEYKERSFAFLRSAAQAGSIDAINALGDRYANGIMLQKDLSTSYAYFLVTSKVNKELVSQRKMDLIYQELTPAQRVEANHKGMEIYNECCRRRSN